MKRLSTLIILSLLAVSCGDSEATTTTTSAPTPSTEAISTSTTADLPEQSTATPGPTAREVRFPSTGLELAGTLRLPEGDNAPAVVLIHGSGPNSRDAVATAQLNMGFGFGIPIFAELGDALQQAGFAVLTYDKRSCGPFNGCADNGYPFPGDDAVVDDLMVDAKAAVAFLREQPEVDPARVSVIGHSQGAEFVPGMLAADATLASGVMLAGPFRSIDEIDEFQYTSSIDLLVELGMSEDEALATPGIAEMAARVEGLRAIRDGGTDPVSGTSALYWQSWFDLGQAKVDAVGEVQQPVLILGGGYDWSVPPTEAEAWGNLFAELDREHTVVILDCITHALNCVTEEDVNAIAGDDIGEHVAPEVLDEVIAFLSG